MVALYISSLIKVRFQSPYTTTGQVQKGWNSTERDFFVLFKLLHFEMVMIWVMIWFCNSWHSHVMSIWHMYITLDSESQSILL